MATECRRKKKISRLKIARIQVAILFSVLVIVGIVIGIFIGKATTKKEVETVIETVEVPSYQENELPEDTEVYYFDVPLSHSLQKYIYEICADEEVPVTLVIALIEHESEFNQEEVSDTDDYGLMQINECNHSQLAEEYRSADMLNPYQNVFCGVKIIASYLEKYEGDLDKALMAYNMGDYGAQKCWEEGLTSSSYSRAVISLYEQYEEVLENVRNADNEQ